MIDERPVNPVDDEISPYLQQPLRTLEQAEQDRNRQQGERAAMRPISSSVVLHFKGRNDSSPK